ncbi:F-box protein SKIP23-like [Musa acuminata AAA Group]|uniref:F-box protein SKIP23-like n=1 Tax=Musa acuminata AAA Group TaxID=214697 RepID=UPI0031DF7587
MASSQATRPAWTELPQELIKMVSDKMIDISDYVRLRAVCKSWRSAAPPSSFTQRIPWLLLPYNPDSGARSFFSLSTHQIYSLSSPQLRGRVTYGSSHGWLLTMDRSFSVSLLNPVTNAFVRLPAITRLPDFTTFHFERHEDGEYIYRRHVGVSGKVNYDMIQHILLCSAFAAPGEGAGDCIVTVTSYLSPRFLCCRWADEAWTLVDSTLTCGIDSLTMYRDKLYLVGIDGSVVVCAMDHPRLRAELVPSLRVPGDFHYCSFGVVGGELLLVTNCMRRVEEGGGIGEKASMDFFKLDSDGRRMRWAKLEDDGECPLLLTENQVASAAIECEGRYACFRAVRGEVDALHHRTEVVQMEEGRCRLLPCHWVTTTDALGPAWFTPTLS